jgi:hypothetical protein
VAAAAAAVRAAIATKAAQQASAQVWMDASEPEAPAAYPVAATSDPLRRRQCRPVGSTPFPSREERRRC